MSNEQDLFEKMKAMSTDELESHYNVSIIAARILNIMGIGTILFALIFSNIFVILLAAGGTFVLGQLAVGLDETKTYISDLLEKKYKINS